MTQHRDPRGRFGIDGTVGAIQHHGRKHDRIANALHGIEPRLPRRLNAELDADLLAARTERATAEAKLEAAQAAAELAALRTQS